MIGQVAPKPETLADMLNCTECGRRLLPGERRSLRFADLGEVAIYCPECDRTEFSGGVD
jgi:RNase P subunit RPR2